MQGYMVMKWQTILPNQDLNQKYMVLNLLLQSRMPTVLAWLRTGPQLDGNLCGINERLLEDEGVCRLDVYLTNNTYP